MCFIKCPFNYVGGKNKLLPQIIPLFKCTDTFYDVFCGGGNVGININSKNIVLNDKNTQLIELMKYIKNTPIDTLLHNVEQIIYNYKLSNTSKNGYEFYGCDSSKGLASYNKNNFLKLRNDYNQNKDNLNMLYVLIVFAFNNQIRFNAQNEYNLPVGKRDFNANMRKKLIKFSQTLNTKNIKFLNLDFRQIDIKNISKNAFVYCDPPYLITNATYNENSNWSVKDELDLLAFLDALDLSGYRFALSNVLFNGLKTNKVLLEWLQDKKYKCNYLEKDYSNSNYQKKDKTNTAQEVLITNY